MNVTSPSLAASLAKTLTPITDPKTKADGSKSTSGASSTGATSLLGSSKQSSTPGQDVAEKLKDMSKALIALTLIRDPIERAKAAAHLYKQYSQVAKDYAAATADGRDAAQASPQASAPDATDPSADPTVAASEAADPLAADPQAAPVAPEAPPVDLPPIDAPGVATPQVAAQDPTTEAAAAEAATTPMTLPGAKPRFAADLFMEEIKIYAGAAKQMYDSAVQEAKLKKLTDKSKKDDTAGEVEDAKKALTEAAKAVEGPDATAEVQMPSGASSSSPSASILNIKA